MDLNDYRRQIDEIDTQLLALFAQRMEVAAGIAAYKKEHDLPVLDSSRERQKLLDIAAKSPDAVKEYAGIDFGAISDNAQAVAAAEAIGVELPEAAEPTWGNALYACFDQRVEEKLIQPTFITMYPVEVSPLTKRSPQDKRLTERFELFICHSEMANAYSELNDPIDQRERFVKQAEQRERGDDEAEMLDEDFLTALEYGMPPTGGMGMGIDRCVMLLTNSSTIREVILFPTMKPID